MTNVAPDKVWCGTCRRETTRYKRSYDCMSCYARAGGLALAEKSTPQERQGRASLARRAQSLEQRVNISRKSNATWKERNPEGFDRHYQILRYNSGRANLRRAIDCKRDKIAALEAELAQLTG